MDKYRYLVGWCPDCGRITVIDAEGDAACGCGHELLSCTLCKNMDDVVRAVPLIEDIMGAALKSYGYPNGEEDEAGDGGVLDDVEELFFSLLRDLLRDTGEEEQSVSLKDEAEAMREAARAQDKATRGDLHRFMVAPSPFPVWVRGTDAEDALKALHRDFRRYVEAGFAAALDEDEVALTVIPLDGAHTYHHFPDWASNQ